MAPPQRLARAANDNIPPGRGRTARLFIAAALVMLGLTALKLTSG